jgi:uncharacterized protein (TIGR03382 family)
MLLATLAGTLAACVEQPDLATTAGMTWEEYLAAVPREPATGGYVIDWDIVVQTEDEVFTAWAGEQSNALIIAEAGGSDVRWTDAQKLNITYCVSNLFGARKTQVLAAITAATTNGWEKAANIKFVYKADQDATCTDTNNNVVFDVNPTEGAPYLARAFFPNMGRLERNVLIDNSSFDPLAANGLALSNILTHELGHVLGFRHEHIARPGGALAGCAEPADYRAIGPYDMSSTMHYPQCGSPGNTLALSAQDKQNVAAIYGAPVVDMPTPMNETPTTTMYPEGDLTGGCSTGGGTGGLALGLLALGFVSRRRRRNPGAPRD